MNLAFILILTVVGLVFGLLFFFLGYFFRKKVAEKRIRTAEIQADHIVVLARREAEEKRKALDKESKTYLSKVQADFENQVAQTKRDLESQKNLFSSKEEILEKKLALADKKEKESLYKLQEANFKEEDLKKKESELAKLFDEERAKLQKISGLGAEEARVQLLHRIEIELRVESSRRIREVESEARSIAEEKAKKIIAQAIMRLSAQYTMDTTTTTLQLPSEEMKGRIIGKDGRNIRTFETLSGVDLVIDDTPQVVTLSAFDGVRREAARIALEELVTDGRINPARIEEVVQKAKRGMEDILKEEGEKAILEAQLSNVHPEMVKLVGRLKFRTSYGQNVLAHSLEVAQVMNVFAGELKLDPALARRAGFLHDLGKAVSSEVEGPHALIGGELARRYGEHPDVIHGIEAHHEDIEMKSVWPMLVQAADAVSAARPGARAESYENYVKRLEKLEEIADKHPGVEKSFAIQAGREIRVVVKPDRVAEDAMPALAREISKEIEKALQFPGQIKVTLIRETRVTETAK